MLAPDSSQAAAFWTNYSFWLVFEGKQFQYRVFCSNPMRLQKHGSSRPDWLSLGTKRVDRPDADDRKCSLPPCQPAFQMAVSMSKLLICCETAIIPLSRTAGFSRDQPSQPVLLLSSLSSASFCSALATSPQPQSTGLLPGWKHLDDRAMKCREDICILMTPVQKLWTINPQTLNNLLQQPQEYYQFTPLCKELQQVYQPELIKEHLARCSFVNRPAVPLIGVNRMLLSTCHCSPPCHKNPFMHMKCLLKDTAAFFGLS